MRSSSVEVFPMLQPVMRCMLCLDLDDANPNPRGVTLGAKHVIIGTMSIFVIKTMSQWQSEFVLEFEGVSC